MNAQQRRQRARMLKAFEHSVVLEASDNERYFQYDDRVQLAKGWLQWQTKRKHWTLGRTTHKSTEFLFSNGAVATVFALKWV